MRLTAREAGVDEAADFRLAYFVWMMARERSEAAELFETRVRERAGEANAQRPFDEAAKTPLRIDFLGGVDPLGEIDHA